MCGSSSRRIARMPGICLTSGSRSDYGGAPIEVETRRFSVAGALHYEIISVGGDAAEP